MKMALGYQLSALGSRLSGAGGPESREPRAESQMEVAMKEVIVRGGTSFKTEIHAGPYTFYADEPADLGGTEAGPTPYDFLSAALGACTSMTVYVVAKREN